MDRARFMERLEQLLSDVPEAERMEALDYYEGYFDDAGPEREADVIKELGSPEIVAAGIRAGMGKSGFNEGEFTDWGYEDARTRRRRHVPVTTGRRVRRQRGERHSTSSVLILAIIALVFLSPLIGALKGILKLVIGLLVVILFFPLVVTIGLGAAGVGLIVAGAGCVAGGAFTIGFAAAIFSSGIGLILIAVGILLIVLAVFAGKKLIPGYLQKLVDFGQRMLGKFRKEESAR